MKIGIDIKEVVHEKAGKGYYTCHLVDELLKIDTNNRYFLYSDEPINTFEGYPNAYNRVIPKKGIRWHYSVLKDIYKEKIDIFIAPTSYIIPALHNPKKVKVIMTVHDIVSFLFPSSHNKKAVYIEKIFLKKALKKAAKIIPVSSNTKEDLINRFYTDPTKINVIYNAASDIFQPIDKDTLKEFKEEADIPDQFIFAAGTLEPRKNFPMLIRAFIKIKEDFPSYKLLIAGKKGWHFDDIFKTVKDLGAEDEVKFLDYVPERNLVNLYNLATAFVYPSIYEGFGIPPLEAIKSGCAVITSSTSSLPEVVGDAAIKVNPEDESELVKALRDVLSNTSLRDELRNKGFEEAKKFSWPESAKKLLDLIEKV